MFLIIWTDLLMTLNFHMKGSYIQGGVTYIHLFII